MLINKNSKKTNAPSLIAKSIALSLFVMNAPTYAAQPVSTATPAPFFFTEAGKSIIPLEDKSRRKWDSALIGDFDQDGFQDLLLTEHAHRASIYWNNNGVFSQPQTLINGDTHGATAGDYDKDGRIDIVIAQGGGGGSKPRFPVSFQVNKDRSIEGGAAFDHFERSRGRAAKLIDGDNDGALELLVSAFPLNSQPNGANNIYDNINGEFKYSSTLPKAQWLGYKTLVTDFNNDNIADIIFYGGADMVAVQGGEQLTYTNATKSVFGDLAHSHDVSGIAEIDFDNDGDFDLFLTRAEHQFEQETFFDAKNNRFAFFARNQTFQFSDLTIEADFILENLQMAYPDFDVYVGAQKRKLTLSGDKGAERSLRLKANESNGYPSDITEKGLYIGHIGNGVWRVGGDTKSPTSGVIHNVKSTPAVNTQKSLPAILLENRNGVFVDATERMGINIQEQTTSATVADFDNNGSSDLFIVRYGNPAMANKQILLLNRSGKFVTANKHGIISKELGATGSGAESFDYDSDGNMDIVFANERGRWHLFTNTFFKAEENNFVEVKVGSSPSGQATAQSAIVSFKACKKTYKRIVGATGAAFTHSANTQLHFGLGKCTKINHANVRWSNGETMNVDLNKLNSIIEVGKFN